MDEKKRLKLWAKHTFGEIKERKPVLLQSLDIAKEWCVLTPQELTRELELKLELDTTFKQEEVYWRQQSRVSWLKEGDANSRFFHNFANGHHNKNWINQVSYRESIFTTEVDFDKAFIASFQSQFGTRHRNRFTFDWSWLLSKKLFVDISMLEAPFKDEEIKNGAFDLGLDKAPGPDGFPLSFF